MLLVLTHFLWCFTIYACYPAAVASQVGEEYHRITFPEWSFDCEGNDIYLPITDYAVFRPRNEILRYWENEATRNQWHRILEVGPGGDDRNFEPATHVVDFDPAQYRRVALEHNSLVEDNFAMSGIRVSYNVDIDEDHVPEPDDAFDFAYCRHVLEDLQSPVVAFREVTRLARRGYIETPSPFAETLRHCNSEPGLHYPGSGYIHHRFLLWTDARTNTLVALPKYPVIDLLPHDSDTLRLYVKLLQADGAFFNTYYAWDKDDPGMQPSVRLLKHGVDFHIDVLSEYKEAIYDACGQSYNHTHAFYASYILPFLRTNHDS